MVRIFSAVNYYIRSLGSLFRHTNFYIIPVAIFKQSILSLDNGKRFTVNSLMDIWTIKEVILDEHYTRFHPVPKNSVVVDIGAGIGDFCVLANSKAKQIIAYDPSLRAAKFLKKNLKINNVRNVKFYQEYAPDIKTILSNHKLERIDFLKIDCEGCEYQLLLAENASTFSKISYISAELHMFNSTQITQKDQLLQKLQKNGFQTRIVQNPVHDYICYLYANKN